MMTAYQIFGSASSEDLDVVFFVDELGSIAENSSTAKQLAAQLALELNGLKRINPNLAIVFDGKLTAVYKGTVDELNNALFHTYALHQQVFPLQITTLLARDWELKIIRSVRTVLSYFTKTSQRVEVKSSLHGDVSEKIRCLQHLRLDYFDETLCGISKTDFYKVVAFQVGQTTALLDGIECYTKEDIAYYYPELEPYLMRRIDFDKKNLYVFLDRFIERVNSLVSNMVRRKE